MLAPYRHHNLPLENLPIIHKQLIHSYIKKAETAKETNWEQKFQKPQNENFCLTNLNVENNGNFPILSFGVCNTMEQTRDFQIRKKKGEGDVLLPK